MKVNRFSFLVMIFGLFVLSTQLNAQVIEADPKFPTINDSVAITFNINECECSMMGYTGDIYAHTGVLTAESTGPGDWKFVIAEWSENLERAKLEKIDDTTYTLHITPDIFTYYDLSDTTISENLAFVFRSPDGSKKSADLFYTIYEPGLSVMITEPSDNIIVELNSVVPVSAEAVILGTSDPDSISLYVDEVQEFVSYTTSLEYDYTASSAGQHWIKVTADNDEFNASDSTLIFVREEITVADLPSGVRDGVNVIDENTVTMVIYAPRKESILALGDFNNWELSNDYLLNQTPDGNRFWITLSGLNSGEEYAFQYLIDGNIRIADPYTEKILDPANDQYIPASTYPDLKPYPNGKTSGIVSVFQTVQEDYEWQSSSFAAPSPTDLVIYEIHVQNYTEAGNISSLTDTLDYLEHLGVNAIELMPVNEFEGNLSWGYNPSFYFAFDKTYGTKNDFKAFVDACHIRGIAVIIDMVLNHSYSQSPLLQMYWNSIANKPAADNPWYNTDHNFLDNTSAHWGYDFNHESVATQNLVDSINSYWMSEYRIDGFRFDFTKGFSNTPWSGANNWASTYDADRIAILERMADEIWARNEDAYVIFEHLADNSEETELADYGIMLWGIMTHDYNEATMGYPSNLNWGAYTSRGWSEPNLVTYMESHDEERMMYKNLKWGNSNDDYDATDFGIAMLRMEAAAAFLFTVPGPKMLFQWGELGNDNSINRCSDGSVNDDGACRLDLKPIVWDYYADPYRYRLYKVFEALIRLRIEEDLFETADFNLQTSGTLKKIQLNSASMNASIIGNFGMSNSAIDPAFQHTGTWYDYMSGESLEVSDVNAEIDLAPGEYKIYLDMQLDVPDLPVSNFENYRKTGSRIKVYPNPANGVLHIELEQENAFAFELYSLTGQKLMHANIDNPALDNSIILEYDESSPAKGIYFYKIIFEDHIIQDKLIVE